jgi:hypothetical protein
MPMSTLNWRMTLQEKNYEMAVKNTISDLVIQLKKRKAILKSY